MSKSEKAVAGLQLRAGNQTAIELKEPYQLHVDTEDFYLEDGTDTTKVIKFDASGLTAGTTRTITLPDASFALGSNVGAKRSVVATGGAFATPIVLTAADSGKTFLLDTTAGLDFTLPAIAAADVGIWYKFLVTATIVSNSYRFTAQSGDLLRGGVLQIDFDAAYTAPQAVWSEPNESSHLVITLASTATGAKLGGWFTLTAISATGWFIEGVLVSDGTIAAPYS